MATVYDLTEYVDIARTLVATDLLIPSDEELAGLGQGWDLTAPVEELERGIWVVGRVASFAFHSLGEAPHVLAWEARGVPLDHGSEQDFTAIVNGEEIGGAMLPDRWREGSLEVPARFIQRGMNRVELRFNGVPEPASDSTESRRLAARFRFLRIAAAGTAAPWIQRPKALSVRAPAGARSLVMPSRSAMDLVVELPAGGQFLANLKVDTRDSEEVRVAVAFREAGRDWRAIETLTVTPARPRRDLAIELPSGTYPLRLTISGKAQGTATFEAPRIVAPEPAPAAALRPAAFAPVAPWARRPNVVIVLLDAARADAFSPFGGRPTPAIAALAAHGTVFAEAFSPAPWTGPSVASLLTGRYPEATGVQTWDGRLPETLPTLFELAGDAGYRTLLWSQHTVYRGNRTLRRGAEGQVLAPRQGDGMLPSGKDLFEAARPTLALVHLIPPHGPYAPPPPFLGRYSGWWEGDPPPLSAAYLNRVARTAPTLDPEYVRYVRDRYDENAAYADALLGDLIATIDRAGRLEDTLIVVLSDHGEAFYEHGRFLHTEELHREMLHVPLVIKWPADTGSWAARVEAPVSLVDLLPTLAEALDLEIAAERLQGMSLLAAAGGAAMPDRGLLASTQRATRYSHRLRPMASLQLGDEVLIHDEYEGRVEFYDLSSDPTQQHDLAAERPLRARFLAQQLALLQSRSRRLLLAEAAVGAPLELEPEVIEELRALGYVQ